MDTVQPEWALLLFELPSSHSNLRVKIWRRLQKIGALNLKNGAYVLPKRAETEEDFDWLRQTLLDGGGQAMILFARARNPLDHKDIIRQFQVLSAKEYRELLTRLSQVQSKLKSSGADKERKPGMDALREIAESLKADQHRLSEIQKVDFFPTQVSEEAKRTMESIKRELKTRSEPKPKASLPPRKSNRKAYQGKAWVTRNDMHVDRLASAWLIRTFIDPKARFRFVADKNVKAASALGIPFDMNDVEFGHHGEDCSFETLLKAFDLGRDTALRALGEIIHDVDIKDGKFGRSEGPGINLFVRSLREKCKNDSKLLQEGSRFFSALYVGLKS